VPSHVPFVRVRAASFSEDSNSMHDSRANASLAEPLFRFSRYQRYRRDPQVRGAPERTPRRHETYSYRRHSIPLARIRQFPKPSFHLHGAYLRAVHDDGRVPLENSVA